MESEWPLVPLGQMITQSNETIEIQPDQQYRQVTVRLWGEGVVLRNEINGARISARKRRVIHSEQFILSRIDARNGALGLVPKFLDGAIVSNDFPSFDINRQRLEPHFLEWMSKTEGFVDLCKATSEGTTNRVRLQVDRFLETQISLPSLDEQRRIVARIKELAALIEEAQGLRDKAREEAEALWESELAAVFDRLAQSQPERKFAEVCRVVRGGSPRPAGDLRYYDGPIPFLKVADLTKDNMKHVTSHSATIKEAGLPRSRYVEPGTLMLTNSGATLGVPKICTFGTCFNDGIQAYLDLPDSISIEYLYYFLRSKTRWFRERAARGQGQPNLNTGMVKELEFPLPRLHEQQRIIRHLEGVHAQLGELTAAQDGTQPELDALLPSILDKAFRGEL